MPAQMQGNQHGAKAGRYNGKYSTPEIYHALLPLPQELACQREILVAQAMARLDRGDIAGFWQRMDLIRAWTMTRSPNADLLFPQEK